MAEVENALKEAERVYELNKKLVSQKVIVELNFYSAER